MEIPSDFSALIAESRAKHIAPAIGAVWINSDATLNLAMHGALPIAKTPQWHIGSCTKAMTATLFARLVDQSLIRFDTTLANALPDLAARMTPEFRKIPMHALLTHSAGIATNPSQSTFRALRRSSAPAPAQRRFLVADALKEKPNPDNGYSNLGYIVLGAVIEQATGQSWESMIAKEIMIPLSISRFGFGTPGSEHPAGHYRTGNTWTEDRSDNPKAYGPAGRVNLALSEWGRFLRAHLNQSHLLSTATRSRLHHPASNGFAMGWIATSRRGKRLLFHTGSNNAWFAQATLLPDYGIGLGIVCNAYEPSIERAVSDLTLELIDQLPTQAP